MSRIRPRDPPARAFEDAEAWWAASGDGQPLGYSNLPAAMDSTPAARRNKIARYFEPTEDEPAAGQKPRPRPTAPLPT